VTTPEITGIVSAAIAGAGAIISGLSLWRAHVQANRASQQARFAATQADNARASATRANDIATGQAETNLRQAISAARQQLEAAGIALSSFGVEYPNPNALQKEHKKTLQLAFNNSIENYLNSYEDACGKYIDGKIDQTRFRKIYNDEVRNLCEQEAYRNLMHPSDISHYKAIWAVYRRWHDLENQPHA